MPFSQQNAASSGGEAPWYGALEFRTLAENVPALLFVSNPSGSVIYTNTTYQRYAGLSSEALLGTGYLDILHPEDRRRATELWLKINEGSERYEIEHRLLRHDGQYRWHHVRGVPVLSPQGEVVRWIGICTDVQDLRSAVDQAHDATELLKVIGRSTDALVFAKDADGRFVFANEATLDALESSSSEVIGRSVAEQGYNASEVASIDENDAKVLSERRMLTIEESWTTSAGVERTYRSTKGPWLRADGSIGIVGITTDITREKVLSEALAEQKHAYRNLTENLPFLLWLTDAGGNLIVKNNLWQSYSGLPDFAGIPLTFADLVDPEQYADFAARWDTCVREGEIFEAPVGLQDVVAGQTIEHRIVAIPVTDRAGHLSGWVGSAIPV